MSEREVAIAVVLRSAQWELDEAAFKAGSGRLTRTDCAALMHELGALSTAIKRYADSAFAGSCADETS
ncbi:hypothetical protein [Saccharopolyspora mangrovi]|uniref:Uncharacterized protein n=1 Tax=Saccharopolyspora mangrovi TaxID=3082379 RepID=A0ABU6AJK2_9PSEU|nr:hypothetical protein [Saccharopolyspora sp. S2-29]MEB3371710.1 hypothetical protein [Saccharopolyspora sp. S2-29]